MKLKTAKLHESAFIVGVGTMGPVLGAGGNNTPSQEAQLVLDGNFLYVTYKNDQLVIPVSNVKQMTPVTKQETIS